MSTFDGLIREIHGLTVCVDDFRRPADFYFLSHCHSDHIAGLSSAGNIKIHASPESARILRLRHPQVTPVILEPDSNYSFMIDKVAFSVYTIDANHCPGINSLRTLIYILICMEFHTFSP